MVWLFGQPSCGGIAGASPFRQTGGATRSTGVVETIAELGLVVTHVAIGYRLRIESASGGSTELTAETVAE